MPEENAPTALGDIRSFLEAQGSPLPLWSSGHQALDDLLALLAARRADPAFWAALAPLVRRLSDRQRSPPLQPGAEVLDEASLSAALEALRQSLPAPQPGGRSARGWATGLKNAAALTGFVLLGAAVACDGGKSAPCDEATAAGLTDADEIDAWCALVDLIRDADLTDGEEALLLDCLPLLTAAERSALLEEFASLSEDELAARLSEVASSSPCYEDEGGH